MSHATQRIRNRAEIVTANINVVLIHDSDSVDDRIQAIAHWAPLIAIPPGHGIRRLPASPGEISARVKDAVVNSERHRRLVQSRTERLPLRTAPACDEIRAHTPGPRKKTAG